MGYNLHPNLSCDAPGCHAVFEVNWHWTPNWRGRTHTDAKDIRREAHEKGWKRKGKFDVCPAHAAVSKQSLYDAEEQQRRDELARCKAEHPEEYE